MCNERLSADGSPCKPDEAATPARPRKFVNIPNRDALHAAFAMCKHPSEGLRRPFTGCKKAAPRVSEGRSCTPTPIFPASLQKRKHSRGFSFQNVTKRPIIPHLANTGIHEASRKCKTIYHPHLPRGPRAGSGSAPSPLLQGPHLVHEPLAVNKVLDVLQRGGGNVVQRLAGEEGLV